MPRILLLSLVLLFSLFAHGSRVDPLVILAMSIVFVLCAAVLASIQVSEPTAWSAHLAALEVWTIFLLSSAVIGTTTGSWMYSGRDLAGEGLASSGLMISIQTLLFWVIFTKAFNTGGRFIEDVKRSSAGLHPVRHLHRFISMMWEFVGAIPVLKFRENIKKLQILLYLILCVIIMIIALLDNTIRNEMIDTILDPIRVIL